MGPSETYEGPQRCADLISNSVEPSDVQFIDILVRMARCGDSHLGWAITLSALHAKRSDAWASVMKSLDTTTFYRVIRRAYAMAGGAIDAMLRGLGGTETAHEIWVKLKPIVQLLD